jgi:nucleoside-diphosphate-sugar epimerase
LRAADSGQTGRVTEDWPVEPFPERRGSYTQAKTEAEKIVLDAVQNRQLRAALLRPGRVFGPGAPLLTPDVARRVKGYVVILGDGERKLPLVYVEDLVDAIVLMAEKSAFDGTILHIVDPTSITQNELVRCTQQGGEGKVIHVPISMLYGLGACLGVVCKGLRRANPLSIYRLKSALTPLEFDCTLAQKKIGWQPRIGIWSGLQDIMAAEGKTFSRLPSSSHSGTAALSASPTKSGN